MKPDAKHTELLQLTKKVRDTKSRLDFLQQTQPIHPIGPYTIVAVRFVVFGCIWDRFVTA